MQLFPLFLPLFPNYILLLSNITPPNFCCSSLRGQVCASLLLKIKCSPLMHFGQLNLNISEGWYFLT